MAAGVGGGLGLGGQGGLGLVGQGEEGGGGEEGLVEPQALPWPPARSQS